MEIRAAFARLFFVPALGQNRKRILRRPSVRPADRLARGRGQGTAAQLPTPGARPSSPCLSHLEVSGGGGGGH